ncbi:outer membrane beta-barrel protein [bacterium]|nr:outer membrane beta-barrel protein [bacterium]
MRFKSRSILKGAVSVLMILLWSSFIQAADLKLGLRGGYRQLKDSNLKNIYGNGNVYVPYVSYFPSEFYGLELSYEGGYSKEAPIGLFDEQSTLSVQGLQLCGVLRYRVGQFVPYFKFGGACFFYKQDIESEYIRRNVDHHKWTTVVGAGVEWKLFSLLSLAAEWESIPLKVKPFDVEVDLGGSRFLLGLGMAFSF